MKFRHQAQFIKTFLDVNGLSARDFAKKIEVSDVYVSNMVNGKAGFPACRAHKLSGRFVESIQRAAVLDFDDSWLADYRKGLQDAKANGKGLKHEKTKAKKEKFKTKNRQL